MALEEEWPFSGGDLSDAPLRGVASAARRTASSAVQCRGRTHELFRARLEGESSLPPAVGLCGHVAGAAGIGAGAMWAPARGRGNGPAPHRTATSGLGGMSTLCAGGRIFASTCWSSWHSRCHFRAGGQEHSLHRRSVLCGHAAGAAGIRAGVVWAPAIARAFPGAFGSRHSSPTPAVGGGSRAAGAAGIQAGVVWAPAIARAFPGAFWRAEGSLTPAMGGDAGAGAAGRTPPHGPFRARFGGHGLPDAGGGRMRPAAWAAGIQAGASLAPARGAARAAPHLEGAGPAVLVAEGPALRIMVGMVASAGASLRATDP